MDNYPKLLFLILLFFCCPFVEAQQLKIDATHYGVDKGLSHREAHVVFEDNEGFIWVGTKYGLNRFDGEEFKIYQQTQKGFNFNNISRITQDDEGWLWLWNDAGFTFFHPKTQEVLSVKQRFGKEIPFRQILEKQGSWKYWSVRTVPENKKGQFALPSIRENEFFIYDNQNGFQAHKAEGIDSLSLKYFDNGGNIYFVGNNSSKIYNIKKNKITFKETPNITSYNAIGNKIYTGIQTTKTISKNEFPFSIEADKIISFNYISSFINPVLENVWSFHSGAWGVFDFEKTELARLNKDENVPDEIFNFINHHYIDSKGNFWLATDAGLTLLQLKEYPFVSLFQKESHLNINNSTRGIWKTGNDIYANLEMGGFCKYNNNNGKWEVLDQSLEDEGIQIGEGKIDYWGRALYWDEENEIFLIGGRKEIRTFQPETGKIEKFIITDESGQQVNNKKPIDVWYIFLEKNNGTLWLGTGNGLFYKEKGNNHFNSIPQKGLNLELSKSVVLNISKDADGRMLLCTNKGIFFFNSQNLNVEEWASSNESATYFIPVENVQHVYLDENNIYWIASDKGLIEWNKEKRTHQRWSVNEGLPDNNIYGILEDKNNNLWMGTDQGLVRFNKSSFKTQSYNKSHGLPFNEFNRTSFHSSYDGYFYFGGMNGVVGFHPDNLQKFEKEKHQIRITSIQTFGESANTLKDVTQKYLADNKIVMDDDNYYFDIDFSMMNFGATENNRYQYKIKGLNDSWIGLKESKIRLNRLPFGDFILKIRGSTNGTFEDGTPFELNINVPTPFYRTVWFYVLLGFICLLGILFYFWQRDIQQKKIEKELQHRINLAKQEIEEKYVVIARQKKELEKLNITKDQIFAIIGHDLRKPSSVFQNMGRKINYLVQNRDFDRLEQLTGSIEKDAVSMNILTENLLNWAMKEKGTLVSKPTEVDIDEVIDEVITALNPLSNLKKITIKNRINPQDEILVDRNSLQTILMNIIDNAIKFTPSNGKIFISSQDKNEAVEIHIRDTGVGMPKEKAKSLFTLNRNKNTKGTGGEKGAGIGLYMVHEFIKQNKGDISVESTEGEGTIFILSFPKSHQYHSS